MEVNPNQNQRFDSNDLLNIEKQMRSSDYFNKDNEEDFEDRYDYSNDRHSNVLIIAVIVLFLLSILSGFLGFKLGSTLNSEGNQSSIVDSKLIKNLTSDMDNSLINIRDVLKQLGATNSSKNSYSLSSDDTELSELTDEYNRLRLEISQIAGGVTKIYSSDREEFILDYYESFSNLYSDILKYTANNIEKSSTQITELESQIEKLQETATELEDKLTELEENNIDKDTLIKNDDTISNFYVEQSDYSSLYPNMYIDTPELVKDSEKVIYLTFNVTSSNTQSNKIQYLNNRNIPTTIFIANKVDNNTLSTFSNNNLLGINLEGLNKSSDYIENGLSQVNDLYNYIEKQTGEATYLIQMYESSSNIYSTRLKNELTKRGFVNYKYDMKLSDWVSGSRLTSEAVIVLCDASVNNMKTFISEAESQGYVFKTLYGVYH